MTVKNKKLIDSEWVKRNDADEPRLSELMDLYKSLGFEVMVKDFSPDNTGDECQECFIRSANKIKTIYTRKKTG